MTNSSYAGRPVSACRRCRRLKVRCNHIRPECERCASAGEVCEYTEITTQPCQQPRPLQTSRSTTENGQKRTRDRAILSCLRCRKHKVRCDRQSPCTRCVRIGKAGECIIPGKDTITKSLDTATVSFDKGWDQERYRNGAHWAKLLGEVSKHVVPPAPIYEPSVRDPCMRSTPNITRSINYPFGDDAQAFASRDVLLANFPSKQAQMVYVAHYMDTIEAAYRLFDSVSLNDEVKAFWDKPSETSDDWLAQYCTVLSLGCQSHNFVSRSSDRIPGQLLQAAESFLRRSPFMFRPTPATIRALCLMVLAKQVYAMSCHEADTCWPLTGMTLRLAMGMGIHLGQEDAQRRLWAAVVYFEMRQTLVCGMSCMLRPVDLASSKDYGGIADVVLGDFGQLLLRAACMAISDDDTVTYGQVVQLDFEIHSYGPALTLCAASICTDRVPHIARLSIRKRLINTLTPAESLRRPIVDDAEGVVCGVLSARVLYCRHVCVLAACERGIAQG
ncbi:hypothetical protein CDV31_003012 [Fusarium ambrosium]|uniref:Zn(2)-C6 fungal-type domain-containing protein n=1 Tax=Fusarium ambrosium TaxID=131363 RepID=A0A428UV24_9HYPO|nr:hypothetical protein CDV31_003012 [Fusarium ambrosium]